MQYRQEIDGLRAIAVLPVILFHGGFSGFSGGYIGVDIFFVISGYLITSNILHDINQNTFSIIHFYERRARRIIPALSLVLLVTTASAFILLPASLLKLYSQSIISTVAFYSNIYFYLDSGYFATTADEKPLLHTWSLAVEEQYYIFFPILVAILWPIGRKYLIALLIALSTASLFYSHHLSSTGQINASFYLIFSRAWELLFGAFIAFSGVRDRPVKKWQKELFGLVGLSIILYAILFFDKQTPFPGFYALIPVMGACAIIVFSDKTTCTGRFLSNPLLVATGLISYSLYLWHQPLFAFIRLKTIGEPGPVVFAYAVILTFILSYLSYRFVEKPFRNQVIFSRKSIFRYSALSIILFASIGLYGDHNNGIKNRFTNSIYSGTMQFSPKRKKCHTGGREYLKPDRACRYFGRNVSWASFGDSHTVEIAFALARRLKRDGTGLLHLSFSACPPALLFDSTQPGCSEWIRESLTYLENNDSIKNVLLGFRYSSFLYGGQMQSYPDIPDMDPNHQFTEAYRSTRAEDARELYWKSLSEIINRLLKSGKIIHLLYPVPELPVSIHKAVAPFSIFGSKTTLDLKKSTTSNYYFSRNRFIIDKLNTLQYGNNLHAIKPFDALCQSNYCPAVMNDQALYFDDDHLSISGATRLIEYSLRLDQ